MILGEGGAMLILEEMEKAKDRGAKDRLQHPRALHPVP